MQGYIRSKARQFMKFAADRYRCADCFSQPDEKLGEDDLAVVAAGMRSSPRGEGISAYEPLVGIGAEGVEQIAATLHFRYHESDV